MKRRTCVGAASLFIGFAATPIQGQSLRLHFVATAPEFAAATNEYEQLWAAEGSRIRSKLEDVSGLRFDIESIEVEVMEGPSWAGTTRMGMRSSYPMDTKRATLAHELGHILIGDLIPDDAPPGSAPDPHYVLFLFLYDVWVDLWGRDFADQQVAVESRRRGGVDYEGIWQAVLTNNAEDRAREMGALVARWRPS